MRGRCVDRQLQVILHTRNLHCANPILQENTDGRVNVLSRSSAPGRGGLTSRFRGIHSGSRASLIPGELPAFFRLKEIAVGSANVRARRGAGTAAQDVLVAHEFAVVFAERAGAGAIAGVGRVGAARPFPNVAEHLVKAQIARPLCPLRQRTVQLRDGIIRLRQNFLRSDIPTRRAPIRTRWGAARPPS